MQAGLTRNQVRAIDQIAIDRYKMTGLVLMENAGRNAAALINKEYGPAARTCIVCGAGNNGGDGLVIARHLTNSGWSVRLVVVGGEPRMTPDTRSNFLITSAMGIETTVALDQEAQQTAMGKIGCEDIVIDALLGTGFTGCVRSPTEELIQQINKTPRRALVAIDLPSGLDCDTGAPSNATITADLTITFVDRKVGFDAARALVGRIEVADIGVPRPLIEEVRATEP